jgi:hypothetical protein
MDFENKLIEFREPFYTTDSMENDFEFIHNYFKGVKGFKPDNSFGV